MNQTARIISIYAADTSGFCSALYEYGGMVVIHDASGCNSTYTTHDEPRWYKQDCMMYISGLTESDAVMGNDEKFVTDLCLAAEELRPKFIAICASALPAMVGVDMEAIAYEVESRTGIPSFEVKTNAMQSYITGAANAFVELAKKFGASSDSSSQGEVKVNILGLTPLDFPLYSTTERIRSWLEADGIAVNSFVGMDTDLDDIRKLHLADVNLVVSSIGKPLAEYLYSEYDIPYVTGTPYGKKFSEVLAKKIHESAVEKKNINAVRICREELIGLTENRTVIIGESVMSTSLATAISLEYGTASRVLESVGDGDLSVLCKQDLSCSEEDELEKEIQKSETIIADPLFEPICRGKKFIRLPHRAFSGRTFDREERQLICGLNDLLITEDSTF